MEKVLQLLLRAEAGVWGLQIGANAQMQVVLCSINGTGTGSQKNCGPGFVCAPLSRADLNAEASFNANSITPQPSLAGVFFPSQQFLLGSGEANKGQDPGSLYMQLVCGRTLTLVRKSMGITIVTHLHSTLDIYVPHSW